MNISKIRRIRRGLNGLSFPSLLGNPYMQTDGMAYPVKNSMDAITNAYLLDLQLKQDLIASKKTDLGKLKMALKLAGTRPSFGNFLKNNSGNIGLGIDTLLNLGLFQGYKTDNSSVANGVRLGYDFVADNVFKANPVVGGWMKAAGFAGDIMSSMGMTTDLMTGFDKVMGGIPVLGNLMSIGAKKTHDFSLDKLSAELVGGSYGGFMDLAAKALEGAGKKYSVFSSGARRRMNRKIDLANNQQDIITDIADEAADQLAMVTSMSQLNHIRAGFTLNGGLDLRYIRAAKNGDILKRVKRINFRKLGGEIIGAINLDSWQPVITEAVEQFENGGELEWTPVITEYKQGGKSEELSKEESELEETNLKNIIPEGALHAHKHHMENADNLTKKGIPVVDNDGEQLAEIEKNEIIFTLEVTKRLEELYSKYLDYEYSLKEKDEVAILAGKLLVEEILFNTDDRTGLINTLLKGGKINGTE